jgi:hypothetical protein
MFSFSIKTIRKRLKKWYRKFFTSKRMYTHLNAVDLGSKSK